MYKTHTCGELRPEHAGENVVLAGWVNRRRVHGGITFIDLRDRFGIVQLVVDLKAMDVDSNTIDKVRSEWVIKVTGVVRKRPEELINLVIPTGGIEVDVKEIEILNPAKTPPIYINKEEDIDEQTRLKYRYLDLRRERMKNNIVLRHKVVKFIRDYLDSLGFLEVETPILFKSTPEGARDYLVPSRVHPGEFYALPQSPQQLKQLLMVAGVERYFQIARCFRDEDQRGDRQPEFTQLDLEMSFVEREDIMALTEDMFTKLVKEVVPEMKIMTSPWPRFNYDETLEKYGKDNPDIRFGMELQDISQIVADCGFKVFEQAVNNGGSVRGINASGLGDYSRKKIEELTQFVKNYKAKGLAYIALTNDGDMRSSFVKFISDELRDEIISKMDAKPGDLLLFVADETDIVFESLGRLRELLGDRLNLIDRDVLGFCWVVNFPLVMWNEEENRWDPSHHLFTAPMPEDIPDLDSNPAEVRGQQYDMVINGYEVGGGSIRIHQASLQEKIFQLIGLTEEVANERFGHILEAFEYGTPPHGGIAPGIDRLCMVLAKETNIREVIAFPKNQNARDVMAGAPTDVESNQLDELHICIKE